MVTSKGELLIVYNVERNGSLWSNIVFEKEVIFHKFNLDTSELDFEVFCSFITVSQLQGPIELKFVHVCFFMHMLKYTKWEDWPVFDNNQECPVSLSSTTTSSPAFSWRRAEYTVRNVKTKPALFRATTPSKEIYSKFYPQVYYLFIVFPIQYIDYFSILHRQMIIRFNKNNTHNLWPPSHPTQVNPILSV